MDQESRESGLNGDGDKQILAPAEGPRENLINTAVKFLQNPKVMSSPLYQKKAFLEKKGLTQEEIQLAVSRAGVVESEGQIVSTAASPPPGYQPGVIGGHTQPMPVYAPMPPQSRWARARDLAMTTVIVAGVSYSLYHLFHKYVRPWLIGKTAQEARMERLESQLVEIEKSVAASLGDMTKTLASIQTSLHNQQSQHSISSASDRGIGELKSDIASLKGLLLNRNQFPPAPPTSMMLPAWQRSSPATTSTPVPISPTSSNTAATVSALDSESLTPKVDSQGMVVTSQDSAALAMPGDSDDQSSQNHTDKSLKSDEENKTIEEQQALSKTEQMEGSQQATLSSSDDVL